MNRMTLGRNADPAGDSLIYNEPGQVKRRKVAASFEEESELFPVRTESDRRILREARGASNGKWSGAAFVWREGNGCSTMLIAKASVIITIRAENEFPGQTKNLSIRIGGQIQWKNQKKLLSTAATS